MQPRLRRLVPSLLVFCSFGAGGFFTIDVRGETAREILDATGVHGGVAVHVGCGTGELAAAFGQRNGFLVQGLDRSDEKIVAARRRAEELGLCDKVSFSRFDDEQLPYIDNLVNLLVVETDDPPSEAEMLRVLCPEGVAYIKHGERWEKLVKPRPVEMDEWTHYWYDAGGNPVSRDRFVAPPEHLQWVGGPRWGRHHDHMASTSAMVSAGGRVFYIFDEGSTASIVLPARWQLIARDAFNGVVLWKRPVPQWWTHFMPLKSGLAQLPRLLVTTSDHVYAPLALRKPIVKLDAVTGDKRGTGVDQHLPAKGAGQPDQQAVEGVGPEAVGRRRRQRPDSLANVVEDPAGHAGCRRRRSLLPQQPERRRVGQQDRRRALGLEAGRRD